MADLIRKMQEDHTVEDLDTVIDEVYEARGEYDSLGERLDDMEGGAPTPSTSIPAMDGTGSAGTSNQYARADHVHPSDTSKQNALSSTQLDAVNSGIDSEKVEQIETNKNNISSFLLDGSGKTGNLNNVTVNEFAVYTNQSTNLPSSDYCFVRTSVNNASPLTSRLQEAFVMSTGVSYVRTMGGGTWHSWLRITNTP